MNEERIFLMKRPLQWSHLTSGLPIPRVFQQLTYDIIGKRLNAKESADVRIMFGGEIFNTKINNIGFNPTKFNHTEILQFKYDSNKMLLGKLQEVFEKEYRYCLEERSERPEGSNKKINIADKFDTQIIVYGTSEPDLFVWEPVFEDVIKQSKEEIIQMTEEEFESFVERQDPTASVARKSVMQNVRKLDRSIGESLKKTYGYRCQMTGEYVGEQQGVSCVEAHHIIPFVESLDNSTDNLMVLSPNYHRIIHKAKPHFNRKTLSFEFPNGLVEKVKLNIHL